LVDTDSILVAAQLGALSPLAGATLAANMPYLNLERFRYRDQMRKCAAEQLIPLGASLPNEVTTMDQYRGLLYLASLKNNDGLDKKGVVPLTIPMKCPSGAYSCVFAHHQDIFFSTAFSGFAAIMIFLGVALSIGMWSFALPYLAGFPQPIFWVLTFTTILPGLYIYAGRWVVKQGCDYAGESATQLAGVINRMAIAAANPQPAQAPPAQIQP